MRTLDFRVEGQTLCKNGSFSGIVAGSKGYLRCRFVTAGQDWRGMRMAAFFDETYAAALDENMECAVPDEVTDKKSFKMRLVGQKGTTRVTTNTVLIEQVK